MREDRAATGRIAWDQPHQPAISSTQCGAHRIGTTKDPAHNRECACTPLIGGSYERQTSISGSSVSDTPSSCNAGKLT